MSKYESHWKDYNSPLTRNEIWCQAMKFWPKLFSLPAAEYGIKSEKNNISYFANIKLAKNFQKVLAKKIIENPSFLEHILNLPEVWGKEINRFTKQVHKIKLSNWTGAKLIAVYKKFAFLQSRLYAVGTLLPFLEYAGYFPLEKHLKDYLVQQGFAKDKIEKIYRTLAVPTKDSFARQQEYDLLKIYGRFLKKENISQLLKKHTQKWAWVYYVYAGPAWRESDFLSVINDWAGRKIKPVELIKSWRSEKAEILKVQRDYLKFFKTPKEKKLMSLIPLLVWSKPHRKDYQSKSYWHMENFYREAGKRLSLSLVQARSLTQVMLYRALKTGQVNTDSLNQSFQRHIIVGKAKGSVIISSREDRRFDRLIKKEKFLIKKSKLTGVCACSGKVKGTVKIINSTEDMAKMKMGDVLVSVATTPAIVQAMRQAGAILTDEGGLTCHAAIVARELKIPCLIGLKVATQLFKDGDLVELDAHQGWVRKIT